MKKFINIYNNIVVDPNEIQTFLIEKENIIKISFINRDVISITCVDKNSALDCFEVIKYNLRIK